MFCLNRKVPDVKVNAGVIIELKYYYRNFDFFSEFNLVFDLLERGDLTVWAYMAFTEFKYARVRVTALYTCTQLLFTSLNSCKKTSMLSFSDLRVTSHETQILKFIVSFNMNNAQH